MVPYLDHDDFKSARKALIIASLAIIIFSHFTIVGDEIKLMGVTVKLDRGFVNRIVPLIHHFLLFNFLYKSVPHSMPFFKLFFGKIEKDTGNSEKRSLSFSDDPFGSVFQISNWLLFDVLTPVGLFYWANQILG